MDYLLKANGLVIMFFLFYYFFLKNETFFNSIRTYFLIGLIIVVSIPLVQIPIYIEQTTPQLNLANFNYISSSQQSTEESFNWLQLLTFIYLIGVTFFSFKFCIQLISLAFLLSKHQFIKQGNYYFVETSKNISPFSFFNIIIYNKNKFTIEELEQIINHEKAHVLQWHSVDTILAHLLLITLWFNPFVWLYKKAVQQNLEFLADAYALEMAQNQKLYKLTLLKTCNINYCSVITNNFYNSLIKKRIEMLHKNRSKNKSQWKYALLLPFITLFLITFNTKVIAQEKKLKNIENVDNLQVELLLDKNSTDETLKEEADFFKKEFDINLSFKGLKRNSNNEITAIKITSKYKSNSTVFIRKSDEPITPIIISYNSEIDKINIGDASNEDFESTHSKHKEIHKKIKISNTHKFSEKNRDTLIVNSNKFIINKIDDDNLEVEVIETADSIQKNSVKVSGATFISDDGEATKIKINKINHSKNTYVIESDDAKGHKIKTYTINNESSTINEKEKPLVFINGKESSYEIIENISPDSIESISVLKDESAVKKYGKKGKNGVIEVTTKKIYRATINTGKSAISKNLNRIAEDNNPLVLVNGKEITDKEMKALDPDSIKSIDVLKDESAVKKYGEKGRNGVIIITTKKK